VATSVPHESTLFRLYILLPGPLWVVLVWAALALPYLGFRDLHGGEGHLVLLALDVLNGGDWLAPAALGAPLLERPPLLVWLVAAAGWAFGTVDEIAVRAPVVVAALGLALTVYAFLHDKGGPATGAFGGIVCLLSPLTLEWLRLGATHLPAAAFGFAAFVIWWRGREKDRIGMVRMLGAGLFLVLAALTDGLATVGYPLAAAVWLFVTKRRPGDGTALAVMTLMPALALAAWTFAVYHPGLFSLWLAEAGFVAPFPDSSHYLGQRAESFGTVAVRLLPWVALAVPALSPWRERLGIDRDIANGLIALALPFMLVLLLRPGADTSDAIPALPAVAALAALGAASLRRGRRGADRVLAVVIAALLFGYVTIATLYVPANGFLFDRTRQAADRFDRAIADEPAPIYAIAPRPRDYDVLAQLGRSIEPIGVAAAGRLSGPAWLIADPRHLAGLADLGVVMATSDDQPIPALVLIQVAAP